MDPKTANYYGHQRPDNFHRMSIAIMTVLPVTTFALVSVAFPFLHHNSASAAWLVVAGCVCLALLFMAVQHRRTDGPKYWFNIGMLCLVATLIGASMGLWNYDRSIYKYWAYDGQSSYKGVHPDADALLYLDAGKLLFTGDAKLDLTRAIGAKRGKHTVCLAPIVSGLDTSNATQVQFFATGTDCCSSGSFDCIGVGSNPHGGLVRLEDPLFSNNDVHLFRSVMRKAAQAHGINAAQDALFLQWAGDLDAEQAIYWQNGMRFLLISILVFAAYSFGVAVFMHFSTGRTARSKLQGPGWAKQAA